MNKVYMEITYSKREYTTGRTAIVAIESSGGSLISDLAKIAKAKLEDTINDNVVMLGYRYLGDTVIIIE